MANELLGILLSAICIVSEANQNRFYNGTFEGRSFRQACAVRNEDSNYVLGISFPAIYIVLEANQNWSRNGTFKSLEVRDWR